MSATLSKTSNPSASDAASDDNKHATLREVAGEAGTSARRFLQEKSEQAAELRKTAEGRITDHPLQSVAIAAVGGLLLGALLRR